MYVLAYILSNALDKIANPSYSQYVESVYTVMTQFGFLMTGFVVSNFFNRDYQQKNTLFYRLLGVNSLTYFWHKIVILLLELGVFLGIGTVITSLFYGNFTHSIQMWLLFMSVFVQYFVIVGMFSILFSNLLASLGVSILYWITGIVLISFSFPLSSIAFFDSSNHFYKKVFHFFEGNRLFLEGKEQLSLLCFLVILSILASVIVYKFDKRWLIQGT
jgi:putative peptide transport system permease protein